MKLTILMAKDYCVIWVDGQSVKTGPSITNVFSQLSGLLEDTARAKEEIIASFKISHHEKEYGAPTEEDMECAQAQLAQFGGILAVPAYRLEAPD